MHKDCTRSYRVRVERGKEAVERVPYLVIDKISLQAATAIKNAFEDEGAVASVVSSTEKM